MTEVRFYKLEQVRDEQLKFAVIAARYQDKWVLCRHKERGTIIYQYSGTDYHSDVWLFEQDFDLNDVTLQEGETCDKMCADVETIRRLNHDGMFVPYSYLDVLLDRKEKTHG